MATTISFQFDRKNDEDALAMLALYELLKCTDDLSFSSYGKVHYILDCFVDRSKDIVDAAWNLGDMDGLKCLIKKFHQTGDFLDRAAQLLREPSETVEGNSDGKQDESDTK